MNYNDRNQQYRDPQPVELSQQYMGWSLKSIDKSLTRIADLLQTLVVDSAIAPPRQGNGQQRPGNAPQKQNFNEFFDVNSMDR